MKSSKRLIGITAMSDIAERRIPLLSLTGDETGPVVWLTACLHGDEVGGTAIVHDVFNAVRRLGLRRGSLQALPLVNPMGFENVSRYINAEREDLNRCFPGKGKGTMGERMARRLYDTITHTAPSLVIDLHNDWIQSVPYVLLEPEPLFSSKALYRKTLKIARATDLLLVQDCGPTAIVDGSLTGSLTGAGIPAFTIEAGGAGGILEDSVNAGRDAILAILHALEMTANGKPVAAGRRDAKLLNYTNRPLSTSSGLVRFSVRPGDRIEANQTVARVFSAAGACEETIRAQAAGVVLGLADHPRVMPGSEVIAIANLGE